MIRNVLPALLLLAGLPAPLWAQAGNRQPETDSAETREVEIEAADLLVADEIGGEEVRRLVGNVRLRQDDTILRAARAIKYENSGLIVFDGGVTVVDEGDTLLADRIEYESNIKLAHGHGNVVWTDGEVELTADSGRYQVDEKIAAFRGEVAMRDSATTITSRFGEYHVEDKIALFDQDVILVQAKFTLVADSVTHHRESRLTEAVGSVRIYQTGDEEEDSSVMLVAERAEAEQKTGRSRLWGNPVLTRLRATDSGLDTLVVRADRLTATDSDSAESFEAGGKARMWRSDLAAVADTLSYGGPSGADTVTIEMAGSPVLWSSDAQVTGDSIEVRIADGSPVELTSRPNAFVAFEDSSLGRIQQIKGQGLVATFSSDSLRQLIVRPQAEALYFGDNGSEEEDEEESAVQFSSSSIRIDFADGDISKIVASTDVEGQIKKFDPSSPPSLPGFVWQIERRPQRHEMLTNRVLEALRSWPAEVGRSDTSEARPGTASN